MKPIQLALAIAGGIVIGVLVLKAFEAGAIVSAQSQAESEREAALTAYERQGVLDRLDCQGQSVGHVYVTDRFDGMSSPGVELFLQAAFDACQARGADASMLKVFTTTGQTVGDWTPGTGLTRRQH